MKGITAFACMSDIDLDLIEESMTLYSPAAAPVVRGRRAGSGLGRFFASGWGVALLCAVVSLSVLTAIVWVGTRPTLPPAPPAPPMTDRPAETDSEAVSESEPESTAPVASEGLDFRSNGDGTCRVAGIGSCRDMNVVIPAYSPEGDAVVGLYKDAFADCTRLVSVSLPEGIEVIPEGCFEDCVRLTEVFLPAGLREIGKGAFRECTALAAVTLPQSVTVLGEEAFYGCTALVSVTLPDRMESIGNSAFSDCSALTEIRWPAGVSQVPLWGLLNCSSLTRVVLSEDVTVIGGMAFEGCTSLAQVEGIPVGLRTVQSRAFYGCRALKDLYYAGRRSQWVRVDIHSDGNEALSHATLHEGGQGEETVLHPEITEGGVTFISNGDGTCRVKGADKSWEGSITIPSSSPYGDVVTTLDTAAFHGFSGLTSVSLPDTVTVIKNAAFQNCGALEQVDLPPFVTEFGRTVFDRCGELREVVLPAGLERIEMATFQTCVSLRRVVAQEGVVSIEANAFNGCRSLAELTLPAGLQSIGANAFLNCCGLQYVLYHGSRAEWNAVEVSDVNNSWIQGVNVVYVQ